MRHFSQFEPDEARFGEFLACLWQGEVPASLKLERWLYLAGTPRRMVMIWEGDAEAKAYLAYAFGRFGRFSTDDVSDDATEGLAFAFARDLDGFAEWLGPRRASAEDLAHAVDVRRRGLEAPDQASAAAAGRAWDSGR